MNEIHDVHAPYTLNVSETEKGTWLSSNGANTLFKDKARQGKQDKTRQDKTRQGKARQGKTRQETRQDKTKLS